MTSDNSIQYLIPSSCEMVIIILPEEKDFSMRLFDGDAVAHFDDLKVILPLGQNCPIPKWPSYLFKLNTKGGCNFLLQGNHKIHRASESESLTSQILFTCSLDQDNFDFDLSKKMQLVVYVSERAPEFMVGILATGGKPGVFGFRLSNTESQSLIPGTSVLVHSCDKKKFSIRVFGSNIRIKVSLQDTSMWKRMEYIHRILRDERLESFNGGRIGPIVLVVGPENIGKTSFCNWMLNRALDEGINPVYIDLDVYQNSNSIPGSITLSEIRDRRISTIGFIYNVQRILHFGYVNVNRNNIQLYYHLVQKMSEVLELHQKTSLGRYSGAIIDVPGYLCHEVSFIAHILSSFSVNLVVVVGDQNYYNVLQSSILKTVPTEFITQPLNIEPRRGVVLEARLLDYKVRRYFLGIDKSFKVRMENIRIFKFIASANKRDANGARIDDLNIVSVACDSSIENYVFAVSSSATLDERLPMAEVKYFVCLTKVDEKSKTVSVLSHFETTLDGEILIQNCLQLSRIQV